MSNEAPLQTTRSFWNASPCGGQSDLETRKAQRYGVEPWIPGILTRIAATHKQVVEVGCGQGTDALLLCAQLPEDGNYLGLDYSDQSVATARGAVAEAAATLKVQPEFRVGNAEAIDLPDDFTECVYSLGVLHHTANDLRAFEEVHRILKPGGRAYLFLYRKWSIKVSLAKALRAIQSGLDAIFGTERCIYKALYGRHCEKWLGTMLLECFGVPYMKWYSRAEMLAMFARFEILDLQPIAFNLPWLHKGKTDCYTSLGYLWAIELKKR